MESPDLPDPRQAAVPVRTTRGRASKRVATGQFICRYICTVVVYMYYVTLFVQHAWHVLVFSMYM